MSKIYNQQVLCFEFNPYLEGVKREQREEKNKMFEKLKTCWNLRGGSHIDFHIQGVIMAFLAIPNNVLRISYSSSYYLTPPIPRVLIGPHLIFCSLTSPTGCKSPRKCTPVKYKARQKAGFPIVM